MKKILTTFFAIMLLFTAIFSVGCSSNDNELTKEQKQKLFDKYASIEIEYEGYKLVYAVDERTSTSEVSQELSIYETKPTHYSNLVMTGNYGEKNLRGFGPTIKVDILKNGEDYMTYNFWDNDIYRTYNSISIYDDILDKNKQKQYSIFSDLAGSCSFDGKLFVISISARGELPTSIFGRLPDDFVRLYYIPMLFVFDEVEETFKYAGFLEDHGKGLGSYKIIKE